MSNNPVDELEDGEEMDLIGEDLDPFSDTPLAVPELPPTAEGQTPEVYQPVSFSASQNVTLMEYMSGQREEPGSEIRGRIVSLAKRVGTGLGYFAAKDFERKAYLAEFNAMMERRIFSQANANNYPPFGEETMKLYLSSSKAEGQVNERLTKFAQNSRDVLELMNMRDPNPDIHELITVLAQQPRLVKKLLFLASNPRLLENMPDMDDETDGALYESEAEFSEKEN